MPIDVAGKQRVKQLRESYSSRIIFATGNFEYGRNVSNSNHYILQKMRVLNISYMKIKR